MDGVYGLSQVKGIGGDTAEQIVKMAPYVSIDDFIERCVKFPESKVNMGHVKTLVSVGAFDSIVENRRAVEQQLERESSGEAKRCVFKVDLPVPTHPFNLPCSYDWANEPNPPLLPRGRGKAKTYVPKEPPKKCSISCRQYTKPEALAVDSVAPYTEREIMERERELLGVWITYTPWDRVYRETPELLDRCDTAEDIENGALGTYYGLALVEGFKEKRDKNGNSYAFVILSMQDGTIEPICFASTWAERKHEITQDTIGAVAVKKTPRGYQLLDFVTYAGRESIYA